MPSNQHLFAMDESMCANRIDLVEECTCILCLFFSFICRWVNFGNPLKKNKYLFYLVSFSIGKRPRELNFTTQRSLLFVLCRFYTGKLYPHSSSLLHYPSVHEAASVNIWLYLMHVKNYDMTRAINNSTKYVFHVIHWVCTRIRSPFANMD